MMVESWDIIYGIGCYNEMNFYLHMFRGGMVSEWCLYFEIESEQKTAFSVGVKQYCTFPGRLGSGLKFIRSAQMEREIGACFSPIQKYATAEGGRRRSCVELDHT